MADSLKKMQTYMYSIKNETLNPLFDVAPCVPHPRPHISTAMMVQPSD